MRCNYCFSEYEEDATCPDCGYTEGFPAEELFYLTPGTVLNARYIIGQTLGAGGFGIVYKAWDNEMEMVVAIKEFYPSGLVTRTAGSGRIHLVAKNRADDFEAGKRRFAAECAGTAHIDRQYRDNPALVHDVSYFDYNGTSYLVMEYLQGETLTSYVKENGSIPLEDSLNVISAILGAVRDIHSAEVYHRDISPDNIIVCYDGSVRLIDFGAARFGKHHRSENPERVMKPGYSPPEQYQFNDNTGIHTDIYSLGATLYFMLTGLKPDEATNRKTGDLLASPQSLNPEIPEHISDAILKAMAINYKLRFNSVLDFHAALTGATKVSRPESELQRRKLIHLGMIAAVFAVMLLIAGGAFMYIRRISDTLNDASIELWFVLTDDYELNAQRTDGFAQMISDFNELFPNVEVELRGFPSATYEMNIERVLRQGSPVIFESGELTPAMLSHTVDLNPVVSRVRDDVHFFNHYTRFFPMRNQVPTGFNVSCVFINTTVSNYAGDSVSDLSALLASMPADSSRIAVERGYEADFRYVFGGVMRVDSYQFFQGEAGAIFADTSMHPNMQAVFAGRYRMLWIDAPQVPATFGGVFSVANSTRDEQAAKLRLLEFMLSEHGQMSMHVRHRSGLIPLNAEALERFPQTFREFAGFFNNMHNFRF